MTLNRVRIAPATLAIVAAWSFGPAWAQTPGGLTGIPCRISFENTTHGGDWFTVTGEAQFTQIAPQGGGKFVAIGSGPATFTFHPGNAGCRVTNGDTVSAKYMVTMESEDGRTAQVDISSLDGSHDFDVLCPGLIGGRGPVTKLAKSTVGYDPPELPSVTVQLREGAQPISEDQTVRTAAGVQHVGDAGSVTLHYCTLPNPKPQ